MADNVLKIEQRTGLGLNKQVSQQPRLKQKQKLVVFITGYDRERKYYIDSAAAHVLNLTYNREPVNASKTLRLYEMTERELHKLEQNKDIDVIFNHISLEQEKKIKEDSLESSLDKLEQGEYGIGVHGTDVESAVNIESEGLDISNSKTILSKAISLGTNEQGNHIASEIMAYKFGNGEKANVVISVPQYIQNKEGQTIFLGFPEENKRTAGQQYVEHSNSDRIFSKRGSIPKEFILGYYVESEEGEITFRRNSTHYSALPQEKREALYQDLYSNMDDLTKRINELINDGKVEELQGMKERLQEMQMPTYLIDNAIELTQKYRQKDRSETSQQRLENDGNNPYMKWAKEGNDAKLKELLNTAKAIENSENVDLNIPKIKEAIEYTEQHPELVKAFNAKKEKGKVKPEDLTMQEQWDLLNRNDGQEESKKDDKNSSRLTEAFADSGLTINDVRKS